MEALLVTALLARCDAAAGIIAELINDWPIYACLVATWAIGLGLVIEAAHRCLGEIVTEIVGTTFGMTTSIALIYFSSFVAVTY